MGRMGINVFSRPLRYRNQTVKLPDGTTYTFLVGQEKGVDIRIALDSVHMAHENFATAQNRWIKVACAFPVSPTSRNKRGIDKTDWIKIDRATYDACLDPRDYRPASK